MTRRKRYSAEFKREALRRADEVGVTDVLVACAVKRSRPDCNDTEYQTWHIGVLGRLRRACHFLR